MHRLTLLIASIAWVSVTGLRGADKTPIITDLGLGTEIFAINAKGEIAFTATISNTTDHQAVLWDKGVRTYLGFLPGDTESWTADLNQRGQIVGWSTGTCFSRAFVWQGGVMTPLGGCSTQARGINNRGQIVGWSSEGSSSPHAVMWQDQKVTDLGLPRSPGGSIAFAINDNGKIVGQYDLNGISRAFLWESGHAIDLGSLPGAQGCVATGINNRNQVVGNCFVPSFSCGFLWDKGVMTALDHPAEIVGCGARHINDRGDIVGSAIGSDLQSRAVAWSEGRLIDLTKLISPSVWRLNGAYDINERGQIVGLGQQGDLAFRGFLLEIR